MFTIFAAMGDLQVPRAKCRKNMWGVLVMCAEEAVIRVALLLLGIQRALLLQQPEGNQDVKTLVRTVEKRIQSKSNPNQQQRKINEMPDAGYQGKRLL